MAEAIRVVHYLNQFFGGLGGEDRADAPPAVLEHAVGPGKALEQAWGGKARIVATLICGDSYASTQLEALRTAAEETAKRFRPGVVIAGPAFNAGRYGIACGEVCRVMGETMAVPALTAMHPENPAVGVYKSARNVWILPTGELATSMPKVVPRLAAFALKLGRQEAIGPATVEGYLPTGRRELTSTEVAGADRAIQMLLAKLRGEPFRSEVPFERHETIAPAPPVQNLKQARIAVISTAGLVPKGNPDGFRMFNASQWHSYRLPDGARWALGEWEVIHGGFNTAFAQADPNVVVPLDALRGLTGEVFGELAREFYSLTGVGASLEFARRTGGEIAAAIRQARVDAAILVAT